MKRIEQQIGYWSSMLDESFGEQAPAQTRDFAEIQKQMGFDPSEENSANAPVLDVIREECDGADVTLGDEPGEVVVQVSVRGHVENDGIGPYEYWGSKEFDRGSDYRVFDDFDFNATGIDKALSEMGLAVSWGEIDEDSIVWDDPDGDRAVGTGTVRGVVSVADCGRFRKFVDENAVKGVVKECDAPAAGTGPGTGTADVLGPCDHGSGEGYLGPGCFHVPSKVMPLLRRAGKPKKQKNPYAKGSSFVNALSEEEFIAELCGGRLDESTSASAAFKALNDIRKSVKDPSKLDEFVKAHWSEIQAMEDGGSLSGDSKSVFHTAWELLKHAVKSGCEFVRKHWKKILFVLLIIAAMLWFGKTKTGTALGLKLFGIGNAAAEAVKNAKSAPDKLKKILSLAFDSGKRPADWIEVSSNDVDQEISIGSQADGGLFWHQMKNGESCYEHPSMPGRYFKPVN